MYTLYYEGYSEKSFMRKLGKYVFTPFSVGHKACVYRDNIYNYELGGSKQLPGQGDHHHHHHIGRRAMVKEQQTLVGDMWRRQQKLKNSNKL